jgi:hypothetical protein
VDDSFEKRIRTAAVAAWSVVLIAATFLTLQWLIYLAVMNVHPAWMLAMWGPNISWSILQNVWFWLIVAFKFCVWMMALAALWLTLWGRPLRKAQRP